VVGIRGGLVPALIFFSSYLTTDSFLIPYLNTEISNLALKVLMIQMSLKTCSDYINNLTESSARNQTTDMVSVEKHHQNGFQM